MRFTLTESAGCGCGTSAARNCSPLQTQGRGRQKREALPRRPRISRRPIPSSRSGHGRDDDPRRRRDRRPGGHAGKTWPAHLRDADQGRAWGRHGLADPLSLPRYERQAGRGDGGRHRAGEPGAGAGSRHRLLGAWHGRARARLRAVENAPEDVREHAGDRRPAQARLGHRRLRFRRSQFRPGAPLSRRAGRRACDARCGSRGVADAGGACRQAIRAVGGIGRRPRRAVVRQAGAGLSARVQPRRRGRGGAADGPRREFQDDHESRRSARSSPAT